MQEVGTHAPLVLDHFLETVNRAFVLFRLKGQPLPHCIKRICCTHTNTGTTWQSGRETDIDTGTGTATHRDPHTHARGRRAPIIVSARSIMARTVHLAIATRRHCIHRDGHMATRVPRSFRGAV